MNQISDEMLMTTFDDCLSVATSYSEFLNRFLENLRNSGLTGTVIASKINEYLHINTQDSFSEKVSNMSKLVKEKIAKTSTASFTINGRKKSFRSNFKKLVKSYPNLDSVKDEFAFRIIVSSNKIGSPAAVILCYRIATILINFFVEQQFYPVTLVAKKDGKLSDEIKSKIFIPSAPPILIEEYKPYSHFIKDYIVNPKKNGYQGLHVLLKDSKSGRYFEFQIRTSEMHEFAEKGYAAHSIYKPSEKLKCSSSICFEGFKYQINEDKTCELLLDNHGIIKPIAIGSVEKNILENDPIDWLD